MELLSYQQVSDRLNISVPELKQYIEDFIQYLPITLKRDKLHIDVKGMEYFKAITWCYGRGIKKKNIEDVLKITMGRSLGSPTVQLDMRKAMKESKAEIKDLEEKLFLSKLRIKNLQELL